MSSSSQKMITLRSSNGETFEVEESAAVQSRLIESRIEGGYADDVIPLLNTSSEILSRVIQYCKKHAEYAASAAAAAPDADRSGEEALKAWDAEFVQVDTSTLFHLTLAAHYLDIKGLLGLTCQAVANSINDMSPEEVRQLFNIDNDFTPEREEELRMENSWAFR